MTYPSPAVQKERQKIVALLDELPADSLPMVEIFIRFMQTQQPVKTPEKSEQTPWLYPTHRILRLKRPLFILAPLTHTPL
jgi:hypothetical protein